MRIRRRYQAHLGAPGSSSLLPPLVAGAAAAPAAVAERGAREGSEGDVIAAAATTAGAAAAAHVLGRGSGGGGGRWLHSNGDLLPRPVHGCIITQASSSLSPHLPPLPDSAAAGDVEKWDPPPLAPRSLFRDAIADRGHGGEVLDNIPHGLLPFFLSASLSSSSSRVGLFILFPSPSSSRRSAPPDRYHHRREWCPLPGGREGDLGLADRIPFCVAVEMPLLGAMWRILSPPPPPWVADLIGLSASSAGAEAGDGCGERR